VHQRVNSNIARHECQWREKTEQEEVKKMKEEEEEEKEEEQFMIERSDVNKTPRRRHNEIEKWRYTNARRRTAP
jgi:hypothetical protein